VIVVSNTSPLTNLAAVGYLHLLPQVYRTIHIPQAVYRELEYGEQRGDHPPFLETASWLVMHAVPEAAQDRLPTFNLTRVSERLWV
jgi:predicted nucleic acid-binding protein